MNAKPISATPDVSLVDARTALPVARTLRRTMGPLVLAVMAAGCSTVQGMATRLPVPAGVGGAMAAATLPTSGGITAGSAQAVRKGETVEGVIQEVEPRFYRLELGRGEMVTATLYTRIARTDAYSGPSQIHSLAFLDADGGVLARDRALTSETMGTGGFDRLELAYTARRAGAVLVKVSCDECGQRVHYRVNLQ